MSAVREATGSPRIDPVLADAASRVPAGLLARLAAPATVLILSHENPDADTVGAAIGVALLVEAAGGRPTLACSDPIPELYGFLPDAARFRLDPDPALEYDLIVTVDCADLERVGRIRAAHDDLFARLPTIAIDHHASNRGAAADDWIDPGYAATCEMVALLARRLGVPMSAASGRLAAALMAGIVMDTATFAHPNATPLTLVVSAALLSAGAPLSDISRLIYRTKPNAQLRLFGRVLDRLQESRSGRVLWATLTADDLAATGAGPEHSEGLVDLLSQSASSAVAILFKERGAETRISVRTRPSVDATVLAATFGGGGHPRAAGATVPLPLNEAIPVVVDVAERLAQAAPA